MELMDRLHPLVRDAFIDAILNCKGKIDLIRLNSAIQTGNTQEALEACGIREGMWSVLTEEIRRVYSEAGRAVIDVDVPKYLGMHFDINNTTASEWLQERSSNLIEGDFKPSQLGAIQNALQQGFELGRNPRSVALDIVGRINPITKIRGPGLVDLNSAQQQYVINMRKVLTQNPRQYFKKNRDTGEWVGRFSRRDARFDGTIIRAIEEGKSLNKKFIDKVVSRYNDRLLQLRGENIARTETLAALNAASDESLKQVVQEGLVEQKDVVRIWRHSLMPNERPGHAKLEGIAVGPDEPWTNPDTGIELMRPGEGPASEVVNCRCTVEHKINWLNNPNFRKRRYA